MRPESLFPLFAPVASLKGVGPRVAPLLERVAGPLVRDLLFLAPHGLIRRSPAKAASALEGEVQTLSLTIAVHERPGRASTPWKIRAFDDTGFITLVFFKGHGPHLERAHPAGAARVVSGKVERDTFSGGLQIVHPDYMLAPERAGEIPEVEAVYPATAGLASRAIRRFALEAVERAPDLVEWADPALVTREAWPPWREAVGALHAPAGEADLSPQAPPRRRLAYDELLAHQLALAQRKKRGRAEAAPAIGPSQTAAVAESALPFTLTGAQQRCLSEIRADLASGWRMTRLIQGDVG
ncbi:MAG TPA: ATP-dependent DNA helicase RecG, partial [Caulobacteraceae bacterium]